MLRVGGAARRADRQRPRRRLPVQGHRRPDHRGWRPGLQRRLERARRGRVRDRPRPVRGRRLDLVRHHHRHRRSPCTAPAGTRRCPRRAGPTSRSASRPSTGPPTASTRLRALTSDPLVDEVIGAVIVPDQGTKKARDHPDFAAAAAPLGNRLSIHDQPNLGGSGGYSRVMYEALKNTDCQQILFMDDDIRIEPDSILRALAMNRFAKTPTLVGGQMLNLQEPSHLHVMGEVVDRGELHVDQRAQHRVRPRLRQISAATTRNSDSKLLHRRIDVDYNGWWMCMIPRAGRRGARPAAAAVHQVGRRRLRPARRRARLPHRHHARRGDLAHGVERQGRRHRLAGLLPPAQPAGGRGACTGTATSRGLVAQPSEGDAQTPSVP